MEEKNSYQIIFIKILLLSGIVFSLLTMTSFYFIHQGDKQQTNQQFQKALKSYLTAQKMNPISPEALMKDAFLSYNLGLKQKNKKKFQKSLDLLQKISLIGTNTYQTDFLLLKLKRILKKSPDSYHDNLKLLNKKYPNNLFIMKKYITKSIAIWNKLEKKEKNEIFALSQKIITEDFWEHKKILDLYFDNNFSFEEIKKVLPQKPYYLKHIPSYYSNSYPKIDYYWLQKQISQLKEMKNYQEKIKEIKKQKAEIEELKQKWLQQFKEPSSTLKESQLVRKTSNNNYKTGGNLFSNGKLSGLIKIEKQNIILNITAKSSSINNIFSFMNIYLDEKLIAGRYIENSSYYQYQFKLTEIQKGNRLISISFENDGFDKEQKKDRNLFIKEISIKNK